jgi:hypothetical protein
MKIQNIKFKDNSLIEKVAKKLLLEHKSKEIIIDELKSELNIIDVEQLRKRVNDNLWLINQRLIKINQRAVIPSETEITETVETQTSPSDNHCLYMEIREKRNKLFLYVKTNNAFETYVKNKKEIRTSNNLWNKGLNGSFYYGNLIASNELDDINREVILLNSVNYGIFRIVGISEGIEFEINKLVTNERLAELLDKLSNDFVNYYNKNILKQKTAISVIVDEVHNETN